MARLPYEINGPSHLQGEPGGPPPGLELFMQIGQGLDALRHLKAGSVLSVGNFDGLHRGHQRILEMARNLRDQHPGSQVCVVTFEPHPLTVLRPQAVPPKLLPLALKESQVGRIGRGLPGDLPPERPC